jgi:hypothetical protein
LYSARSLVGDSPLRIVWWVGEGGRGVEGREGRVNNHTQMHTLASQKQTNRAKARERERERKRHHHFNNV